MLLGRVIVGHLARRTAIGVLLNNSSRRRLIPACFASLDQLQPNNFRRNMSTVPDSKIGQWSEEELKTEPEAPKKEIHPLDAEEWTQVYRFKYIKQLRFVVRLKMYQAAFCFISTAALPVLPLIGVEMAEANMMFTVGVNFYILLVTLGLGHYAQQLVGLLYVNEPRDKVRVATLSFYGHRADVMYDVQDIMHFSDMVNSDKATFINLRSYSDPKKNLFLHITEGVTNKELFEEVFGTLPQPRGKRVTKISFKKDK